MSPATLELIGKLAVLIPPPRVHQTRFHGVFASNSEWRAGVVPVRAEVAGASAARRGDRFGARESAATSMIPMRGRHDDGRRARTSWGHEVRRQFFLSVAGPQRHCRVQRSTVRFWPDVDAWSQAAPNSSTV